MPNAAELLGISGDSISQILGKFMLFGMIFFGAIVFLIILALIIVLLTFKEKAIVYKAYADPGFEYEEEEREVLLKGEKVKQYFKTIKNKEGLVLGRPQIKKAMFANNKNGILQIRFLFPLFKTSNYIPQEYIYPEGIYFVQIGKEFIAIKKPSLESEKGFVIKLSSFQSWKESNFILFKKYRAKFADKDKEMRIFAFFIIVVIALTILTGFILWLSFKAASGQHADAQLLANAIEAGTKTIAGGPPN